MASKRLKKKRQKRREIQKLSNVGYSAKQIKRLDKSTYNKEIKRIDRNEQQNVRRQKYIAGWENRGIDKKIISQLRLRDKNPQTVTSQELREIKNKQRGYRAKVTRERNLVIQNTVYHAKEHLALAFTALNGESPFSTAEFKKLSYNQLIRKIKARRKEAQDNPSGSGQLRCAFQIMHGSEEDCDMMLDNFSQRGYNLQIGKLTRDEYIPLVNRNDWTKREFAELTLAVISQCPNADVKHHIDELQFFCEDNGFPFNDIFE